MRRSEEIDELGTGCKVLTDGNETGERTEVMRTALVSKRAFSALPQSSNFPPFPLSLFHWPSLTDDNYHCMRRTTIGTGSIMISLRGLRMHASPILKMQPTQAVKMQPARALMMQPTRNMMMKPTQFLRMQPTQSLGIKPTRPKMTPTPVGQVSRFGKLQR